MTTADLKKYLSAIRSGGQQIPKINDIVDVAMESGFASVWGAYTWKVRRKEDTSLTTTGSQAYTTLPNDLESLDSIVLINGTQSWWIDLLGEGDFEIDFPYPAGYVTGKPAAGKVVFNSAQQGSRWRVYWNKVPDAAYSLRVIYQVQGEIGMLANLPSYMVAAIVDRCVEYVIPPGNERLAAKQAADRSLQRAIDADQLVSGPPQYIGADPDFNADAFVGGSGSDGYLEGNRWLV